MSLNKNQLLSTNLNQAILELLLKVFPTDQDSRFLLDIVNILMDGLSRGEIYINLEESPSCSQEITEGWPEEHIRSLIASGWAKGAHSPIIIKGKTICWRRNHSEMN